MFILVFAFFIYDLLGGTIPFTYIKTGGMKFREVGGTFLDLLPDVIGKRYNKIKKEMEVIPAGTTDPRPLLTRLFGLWWLGFIPAGKVRKFKVIKNVENPKGEHPDNWIIEKPEEPTDYLSETISIPYVFRGVELEDGTTVDMLVASMYRIINPEQAIIVLNGNYYAPLSAELESNLISICRKVPNQQKFRELDKSETGFLSVLKNPNEFTRSTFNETIIAKTGWEVFSLVVSKFLPSDIEVNKLTQLKAKNTLQGEADVLKANFDAEVKNIETAVMVKRALELGEAENKGILHGIEDADANMKASVVSGVRKAKVIADPGSPLHMWIEGNPSGIIVQTKND